MRAHRKADADTPNHIASGANAAILRGSSCQGFSPTLLKPFWDDAAEAAFELSRVQDATVAMQEPLSRRHRQGFKAWDEGIWKAYAEIDGHDASGVERCSPKAGSEALDMRGSYVRTHSCKAGLEWRRKRWRGGWTKPRFCGHW